MSSFSEIKNLFLRELEKHCVKHFSLQNLVRHNLPRDFRNIQVPALSGEQLSLLNIDLSQFNYYKLFIEKFNEVLESMTGLVV